MLKILTHNHSFPMSNVECRMSNVEIGQKNALNSVKSPFSAYLIQPCGGEKNILGEFGNQI